MRERDLEKQTLFRVEGPGSSGENYGGGTKEYGGEGGRTTKPGLDRMVDGFFAGWTSL